jgi:hypothetical protein
MAQRRTVFFVSDGTGITAEMLGHSLLTQFEGVQFAQVTLPFVDSVLRAEECLDQIEREAVRDNSQPIVFATLVNVELRAVITEANALVFDFFEAFIDPLEAGLGVPSTHTIGRSHSALDKPSYHRRMEAINFSMAHDDGAFELRPRARGRHPGRRVAQRQDADVPLPRAAVRREGGELPADPEDFAARQAPEALRAHKAKIFGLTIGADGCTRSASSAGPTASTPRSPTAARKCRAPRR